MEITLDKTSNLYIFQCPTCKEYIQVERYGVACSIFRHLYHSTEINGKIELLSQVDPHASREVCEQLLRDKRAVGCGKPFRLKHIRSDDEGIPIYIAEVCDYI